jgi:FkbM family methyltransferase
MVLNCYVKWLMVRRIAKPVFFSIAALAAVVVIATMRMPLVEIDPPPPVALRTFVAIPPAWTTTPTPESVETEPPFIDNLPVRTLPHANLCLESAVGNSLDNGIVTPLLKIWNSPLSVFSPLALYQSVDPPPYTWAEVDFAPVPAFQMAIRDTVSDSFISASIEAGTPWDAGVRMALLAALDYATTRQEPPLVVDVGANIGYFTHTALALGATVFAFEPLSANLFPLLTTAKENHWLHRLHTFQNAVSFEPMTVAIAPTDPEINLSNGHIRSTRPSYAQGVSLPTETGVEWATTVTLDQVLLDQIPVELPIHVIKIDVVTHEPQVVNGMLGLLCSRRIDVILMEVGFLGQNRACDAERMLRFLESFGFIPRDGVGVTTYAGQPLSAMPPNVAFVQQFHGEIPGVRLSGSMGNPCKDYP